MGAKSKRMGDERQIKCEALCVGTAEVIIAYVAGMEFYSNIFIQSFLY